MGVEAAPRQGPRTTTTRCSKCRDAAAALIGGQAGAEVFCRSCHLASCTHRVASTLRSKPSAALYDGATLCIGVSGSAASMLALSILLQKQVPPPPEPRLTSATTTGVAASPPSNEKHGDGNGVRRGGRRRMKGDCEFSVAVVHVDERSLGMPCVDPEDVMEAIRGVIDDATRRRGVEGVVEVVCVPVDERLEEEEIRVAIQEAGMDATAREDFARELRERALVRAAEERKARLVTCETSVRLAARALALVAKGKGRDLRARAVRTGQHHVPAALPMRDVTPKDAVLAARHLGLPFFGALPRGVAAEASINSATAAFVENMQAGMPRTAPTILRTLAKLEPVVDGDVDASDDGLGDNGGDDDDDGEERGGCGKS